MELKKCKTDTIFWLFLKRLLRLAVSILLEIVTVLLLLYICLMTGLILPADYSERYLEENRSKISESEPFDRKLIPHTCKYGLFSNEGTYLSGDLNKDEVANAKAFISGSHTYKDRFYLLERENGSCVVKYDIKAHFASETLHSLFPDVELLFFILFILIFIFTVVYSALRFGKKLRKELKPLLEEIEQIRSRELGVERKFSKIAEFDDILQSLYDMETALSQSLKQEWETQQIVKSNISVIAHDIKTPLTIIKGNSELIMEEGNLEEIYQSADIINSNSDKIERYIKLLIDATKNNLAECNNEEIDLSALVHDIERDSEDLCKASGIEFISDCTITNRSNSNIVVKVDKDSLERAILNLVQNAMEHTTSHKLIKLSIKYSEEKLHVEVEDFGEGFSEEALKNAKKQFYTEKIERSEEHYGLGLYFVDRIAVSYNGSVTLQNKQNYTGAIVTFEIFI